MSESPTPEEPVTPPAAKISGSTEHLLDKAKRLVLIVAAQAKRCALTVVGRIKAAVQYTSKRAERWWIANRSLPSVYTAPGREVYQKNREQSGPQSLIAPILRSESRIAELDTEISSLEASHANGFFTPKRTAITGAIVIALLGVGVIATFMGGAKQIENQKRSRSEKTKLTAGNEVGAAEGNGMPEAKPDATAKPQSVRTKLQKSDEVWTIPYQGDEVSILEVTTNPKRYAGTVFILCGGVRLSNWNPQLVDFREFGKDNKSEAGYGAYLDNRNDPKIVDAIVKSAKFENQNFTLARVKVTLLSDKVGAFTQRDRIESRIDMSAQVIDLQFATDDKTGWQPWLVQK